MHLNSRTLVNTYILSFMIALHFSLPVYINSSYLANFISEKSVGLVFIASAVILLFALAIFRHLLEHLGNVLIIEWLMVAELAALGGLLYGTSTAIVVPAMIIHMLVGSLIALNLDIFLEEISRKSAVGEIRGWYLTASNVGILLSPFLVGLLLTDSDFWKIYTAAVGVLVLIFLMVIKWYATFKDPPYKHENFVVIFKRVRTQKDILCICIANFLLYFFYAIMVVYTPLYLSKHLHFSWATIGWMFTIMLTPFVVLQLPLGRIADKKLGEKELLIGGFFITALTTTLLAYLGNASALLWALALCATRIGASTVEIMAETYFFKKIRSENIGALTFFRMMRPVGYILGPLAATVILAFFDFKYIFLVLGAVMLSGVYVSFLIKDTR